MISMMIKALVSDLDGTLFKDHKETVLDLAQKNIEGLEILKNNNISFHAATGRAVGYGIALLEKFHFDHVIASGYNGSEIYDNGSIYRAPALDKDLLYRIYQEVLKFLPIIETIQFQTDEAERIFYDKNVERVPRYRAEMKVFRVGTICDFTIDEMFEKHIDKNVLKITISTFDEEKTNDLYMHLKNMFSDVSFVTLSHTTFIEICNKGYNKGTFIQYLIDHYYKKEEIAVVGDALNDYDMFQKAGLKFAMNPGNKFLKQNADYIVDSVADTIAIILEKNGQ